MEGERDAENLEVISHGHSQISSEAMKGFVNVGFDTETTKHTSQNNVNSDKEPSQNNVNPDKEPSQNTVNPDKEPSTNTDNPDKDSSENYEKIDMESDEILTSSGEIKGTKGIFPELSF